MPDTVLSCLDFGRFYESPLWRYVVTDLDGVTTTWLDKLCMNSEVTLNHLAPSSISGQVPSDNPEINIEHTDGYPFLDEGDRLVYAFRRDCIQANSMTVEPWTVRAAGVVMNIEDNGDLDAPITTFTAWDPWQFLYARPVLNEDGSLPNENGVLYPAETTYDEIIISQLGAMAAFGPVGGGVAAFAFTDWGQTGVYYTGTIEPCSPIGEARVINQGTSIGQLLDDLVSSGEVEVVFEPIYDPFNRPGYTSQLSIYTRVGDYRPEAVMSWDVWPRNLTGITRVRDGRERMNDIVYNAGQGGPAADPEIDTSSLARFGDYFRQQFFPADESLFDVQLMARHSLFLQADGLITYKLSLASERSPIAFVDYDRGDTVPVYASRRLREPIVGDELRVLSIPIKIGQDQLERIPDLIVSLEAPVSS